MRYVTVRALRKRRSAFALVMLLAVIGMQYGLALDARNSSESSLAPVVLSDTIAAQPRATELLDSLAVKGRAPKTDYSRSQFGEGWAIIEGCDMRNILLARYLSSPTISQDECTVLTGTLDDPYTGVEIVFTRGPDTSDAVQIDHVVALSDAWQKGAQLMDANRRVEFANDPLNLLPVDGEANQDKGDADAASWLPPNKSYRCAYVARQIAVKHKYGLWVTEAERSAMRRVLSGCGEQRVPLEE